MFHGIRSPFPFSTTSFRHILDHFCARSLFLHCSITFALVVFTLPSELSFTQFLLSLLLFLFLPHPSPRERARPTTKVPRNSWLLLLQGAQTAIHLLPVTLLFETLAACSHILHATRSHLKPRYNFPHFHHLRSCSMTSGKQLLLPCDHTQQLVTIHLEFSRPIPLPRGNP